MSQRIQVLKPTHDNWSGSYQLTGYYHGVEKCLLVEVIFNGNITAYDKTIPAIWRTSVWGNDDTGLEYDCSTEADALAMFYKVIGMAYVDMDDLLALGFVYA